MEISVKDIFFQFLGGLALFLFGIKYMSDGLQSVAGDRLREFLEKSTKTSFRGVLTGALVTALIQSSSGTTVLTVGLVNAGLLTLRQAIGVIMGANIGTTITAYLIGFNLKEYALPIIAVGAVLLFFIKNKQASLIGQTLFGFGLLFYGMEVMGVGLKPLREYDLFLNLMADVEDHALLGVLIGTIFTMIVQSSSATIGVLQELADQGAVTYLQAVPILFGDNIGTTITALLASIGTTVMARRAAFTHMLFNITGTMIFLPLTILGIFPEIVRLVTDYIFVLLPGFEETWETINIRMQIAQTHGVFNISNTLIQLPFVGVLAAIVSKLIPGKVEEVKYGPRYLEPRLLSTPSVAIGQATLEILRMGQIAREFFNDAIEFFFNRGAEEDIVALLKKEKLINLLDQKTTDYIVKLSEKRMTKEESNRSTMLLQAINDIERIGDHAENIVELAEYAIKHNVTFSEQAMKNMDSMAKVADEMVELAMKALGSNDREAAYRIIDHEIQIDRMQKKYRKAHIQRLNEKLCSGNAGAVFLDILSNLERIGDHCVNIAEYVLEEPQYELEAQAKNIMLDE